MSKLFLLYKNAFDSKDAVTLDAGVSVAGFTVSNLSNDKKSFTWRSGSLALHRIKTTWTNDQKIDAVALCFANLRQGDSLNIKLYSDTGAVANVYSSGNITINFEYDVPVGFGSVNSNSFAYGGAIHVFHSLPEKTNVRRMDIEFNSSSNAAGFLEFSRIVCGKAWSPDRSAALGAQIGYVDSTTSMRTQSGDLITDRGSMYRQCSFNLVAMPMIDKQGWNNIFRCVGKSSPVFMSISNNIANSIDEEAISGTIYGKFENEIDLTTQFFKMYGSQVRIAEL